MILCRAPCAKHGAGKGAGSFPLQKDGMVTLRLAAPGGTEENSSRNPEKQNPGAASGDYIVHHEDDWFVVATILRRDIGMKGSVWLRPRSSPALIVKSWPLSVTCGTLANAA